MKLTFFVLLCLCLSGSLARRRSSKNKKDVDDTTSNREGKLFSLFTIVNFKNDACTSTSSISSGSTSYRNGTCFTSSECSSKGGKAKGNCASGFGVCCVFMYDTTSDTTVSYNDTYLQNPNYPSAYDETSSLTYTVNKCSSDICWLRLDFETFQNLGPALTTEVSGGLCVDTFKVTVNSGQTVPELCGQLTGQHIYLDMGTGSSDSATLALAFSGTSTLRKWEIKVAQIPCGKAYAPPGGCLQWHTGLTGQITTFNFGDSASTHLRNQMYSSCVRQEKGMCCVEYQVCDDSSADNFSLDTVQSAGSETSLIGTSCLKVIAGMTQFTYDYIVIDGSGENCGDTSNSRYCGQKLNPTTAATVNVPVCDCTPPFSVGIRTDDNTSTKSDEGPNRGVCLSYRQLPCSN